MDGQLSHPCQRLIFIGTDRAEIEYLASSNMLPNPAAQGAPRKETDRERLGIVKETMPVVYMAFFVHNPKAPGANPVPALDVCRLIVFSHPSLLTQL